MAGPLSNLILPLPMARARIRFIVTPWFTYALVTMSESRSPTFFCSAFATAESRSFFTIARRMKRSKGKNIDCISHHLAADKIYDLPRLARRNSYMSDCCACFHLIVSSL